MDTDDPEPGDHRGNGRVRTLLYPEQLEARLRRLRSNARLAIEESGSNMLFLVFGFLEWSEKLPQSRGDDRRLYQAPLVLMPASIDTVTNARSRTEKHRLSGWDKKGAFLRCGGLAEMRVKQSLSLQEDARHCKESVCDTADGASV